MTDDESTEARPRLPDLALPTADGTDSVPVRVHRRGTVLVLLGRRAREADLDFLRRLAAHEAALLGWDGHVAVVVPEADAGRALAVPGLPYRVAVDAAGRMARAAGVDAPALVIADHWGEVHVAERVEEGRAWMDPVDVELWLRTIAVRCGG